VEPTSGHVANYTNLSPGEYTFVVRYLSSNHKLIDQRSLRIVINPPFWDTLWARILELLLLAMVAYYVYYRVKTRIEKKQNEDRLRFFANISYNIRTPLTLIKSPIGELKNSLPSTPKTDYLLDLMSENVDKLTRLFSVFVGLHKAYNNAEQLQLCKVDVSRLLLSKAEFFAVKAARKGLKLSTDMVVGFEDWTDELKLQQIIDNLLAMVIEHAASDSVIAVGLACTTSRWTIFFRATHAEEQRKWQEDGDTSTYLRQYIILLGGHFSKKQHGVEVTYSVSFYRGLGHYRNYVLLDSNETSCMSVDPDMSVDAADDKKYRPTLLVIEVDTDMGKVLKMSLKGDYVVKLVTTGKNIWDNITAANPDIVICDLDMSETNGQELCRRIKNSYETSHIAVVMLTTIDDSHVKQQAFDEGIDAYIEKPFDLDYLRSRINNIINNRNLLRRKFLGTDNLQGFVEAGEDDNAKQFMNSVQQILNKHLNDPKFSVNDFSTALNLSRTLLYSKFRAIAGVEYILSNAMMSGHLYLPDTVLKDEFLDLFGENIFDFDSLLSEMQMEKRIVVKKNEETQVYLSQCYYTELAVAKMLTDINIKAKYDIEKIEEKILKIEDKEGIVLDDLQRQAVIESISNGLILLSNTLKVKVKVLRSLHLPAEQQRGCRKLRHMKQKLFTDFWK